MSLLFCSHSQDLNFVDLIDCIDDEDSVLIIIAEKLGSLCSYLGSSEFTYVLLKPLELLICGEESSIRDKVRIAKISLDTLIFLVLGFDIRARDSK